MTAETGQQLLGQLQPSQSGFIDSRRGASLYYEAYGSKDHRALVLLNGAGMKIPFLGHLIQRMCRLGYRVLVHDPRGIGRSTCRPGPQTTRLLAADALAVVDGALGPDAEFFLMGLDLGGMVAQELLYCIVRRGKTSRVRAAFLAVTSGGERWRPLPYRRIRNVRRTMLPNRTYGDQADFDRRFAAGAALELFSAGWMDAPAAAQPAGGAASAAGNAGRPAPQMPPLAQPLDPVSLVDPADPAQQPPLSSQPAAPAHPEGCQSPQEPSSTPQRPASEQQQQQQGQQDEALQQPSESACKSATSAAVPSPADQESPQPPAAPPPPSPPPPSSPSPPSPPQSSLQAQHPEQSSQQQPPAAAPGTLLRRGDRILGLWSQHWQQMTAALPAESRGLCFHLTALKSHFLGPRRAEAIRASGVKIGVGIATADRVVPEPQQRLLAKRLAAEEYVVGERHYDSVFFEGVSGIVAGALATFGDSRV